MSKNSKNVRQHVLAREIAKRRKNGDRGSAHTQKKTSKRLTWHARKDGKLSSGLAALVDAAMAKSTADPAE
jgi:hypothetical protein